MLFSLRKKLLLLKRKKLPPRKRRQFLKNYRCFFARKELQIFHLPKGERFFRIFYRRLPKEILKRHRKTFSYKRDRLNQDQRPASTYRLTNLPQKSPPFGFQYTAEGGKRQERRKLLWREKSRLRGFCLQYKEKRRKILEAEAGSFEKPEHFDPTERSAEVSEGWRRDCELIEKTAAEVDEELAPYIIRGVTEEHLPPWALRTRYGMPASDASFNRKRRQFFFLLAIKKKMV